MALLASGAGAQAIGDGAENNSTRIIVNPGNVKGDISPLLFGANNPYSWDASGAYDPEQEQMFPEVVQQTKDAGISIVRYPGGSKSNTFHFERAIGPQSERVDQIGFQGGLAGTHNGPLRSDYGPDEHGEFVESIGAKTSLVVNWGTGTADEAANFVEYMTAPLGTNPRGGKAWAEVRAENGHPEPYEVPLVEIGNEVGAAWQGYWAWPKIGTPVDEKCSGLEGDEQFVCHYVHGGSARIEHHRAQRVGDIADRRFEASHSDGTANQKVFAYLPPVVPDSLTVTVDGEQWRAVDDLDDAGSDNVFELTNPKTGEIEFGDGSHGNIPPDGVLINAQYVSGPHEGYDEFYREIKAANPDIQVCPMMPRRLEEMFVKQASQVDCLVHHPSTAKSKVDWEESSFEDYHLKAMLEADKRRADMERQAEMAENVLGRSIPIYASEYGLWPGGLDSQDRRNSYMAGLDQGLYLANALRNFIDMGVDIAEKHVLMGSALGPLEPGEQPSWGAMIFGPGPDTIPQAQALVMRQFAEMTGETYIDSRVVSDVVQRTTDGIEVPSLNTVASKDDDGNLYLIVINQNHHDSIEATVTPTGAYHRDSHRAEVLTVNGDGMFAWNSPDHPNAVTLTEDEIEIGRGSFDHTFPAGSVTAFKLTPGGSRS